MSKELVTIVLCNWNNFPLLKVCINSLVKSLTVPTRICVTLNQSSEESVRFLTEKQIDFISLAQNHGTCAADIWTPTISSKYVVTQNDDQIMYPGWQDDLISKIERYYPAAIAVTCVEPEETGNPMVCVDNLGSIYEHSTGRKFVERMRGEAYKRKDKLGYNHPQIFRTEDWKAVGGYSCGLPYDTFQLGGYCADDLFNWCVWKRHRENFKFIISGDSFVYHAVSVSTKKLPSEIKNFDAHSKFVGLTGMSTAQFRQTIGWGKEIN